MVYLTVPPQKKVYVVVDPRKSNVYALKLSTAELTLKYITNLVKAKRGPINESFVRYMLSIHEFVPFESICTQIRPYASYMIPYIGSPSSINTNKGQELTPTNVGFYNIIRTFTSLSHESALLFSTNLHLWLNYGILMLNAEPLDNSDNSAAVQTSLFQEYLYMLCKLHEVQGFDRPMLVAMGNDASHSVRQVVRSIEKKSGIGVVHLAHPSMLTKDIDVSYEYSISRGYYSAYKDEMNALAHYIGLEDDTKGRSRSMNAYYKGSELTFITIDKLHMESIYSNTSMRKWLPVFPITFKDTMADVRKYYVKAYTYIRSVDISKLSANVDPVGVYKGVILPIIQSPGYDTIMAGTSTSNYNNFSKLRQKCDQRLCSYHFDAALYDIVYATSESAGAQIDSLIDIFKDCKYVITEIERIAETVAKKPVTEFTNKASHDATLKLYDEALSGLKTIVLSGTDLIEYTMAIRRYINLSSHKNNNAGGKNTRVHKSNCGSFTAECIMKSTEKSCNSLSSFASELPNDISRLSAAVEYLCDFATSVDSSNLLGMSAIMKMSLFDIIDVSMRFIDASTSFAATYQLLESSTTSMLGTLNATPPYADSKTRENVISCSFNSMTCKERAAYLSEMYDHICETNKMNLKKTTINEQIFMDREEARDLERSISRVNRNREKSDDKNERESTFNISSMHDKAMIEPSSKLTNTDKVCGTIGAMADNTSVISSTCDDASIGEPRIVFDDNKGSGDNGDDEEEDIDDYFNSMMADMK